MDQLSNDLLEEIFSYLDNESLISVSKVAERFFELIKVSPTLMKKFTLEVTSNGLNYEITIKDPFPRGWHQNLNIFDYQADFFTLALILFKNKNSLSSIKISRTAEWNEQKFVNCFGVLPNLKQLTLEDCQISGIDNVERNFEAFANLDKLKIVRSKIDVEKVFKGIKTLKIFIENSIE